MKNKYCMGKIATLVTDHGECSKIFLEDNLLRKAIINVYFGVLIHWNGFVYKC